MMNNYAPNGCPPLLTPGNPFVPPGFNPYIPGPNPFMIPNAEALTAMEIAESMQDQNASKQKPSSSGGKKKQQGGQKKKGQKKQKKKPPKPKAFINFEKLQAGTVSNSSGIFNGKNIQFGWSSHNKSNSGFGSLGGHNNMVNKNTNVVFDNDQTDTPIDDRDTMWSPIPAAN